MNEKGFALITCLLLIAMVLILSAIASQSITSDLKVAGTDRSMKQAFSIAESGSEEARARLHRFDGPDPRRKPGRYDMGGLYRNVEPLPADGRGSASTPPWCCSWRWWGPR